MTSTYKVYTNTKDAFDRVFKSIENAKNSIYVETYKIDDDSIGQKILTLLIKKSKDVPTELMVDYWGIEKESIKTLKHLKNSRLQYILFNPLYFTTRILGIKKFIKYIQTRNHRKLIILDKKTAFVGGMNFNSEELEWQDYIVEIKGDMVKQLLLARKEMKNIAYKTKPFEKRFINKKLTKRFTGKDCILRQIPATRHRPLKREFLKLLRSAKKEILFTTPYFIPDLPFMLALRKAIKRGVKVKIIIPKKCDHFSADILNKSFAFVEHNEGSQIFLYKGMTHAKYTVVDGKHVLFGSANMDYQTWLHNYELMIMSKNEKLAHDFKNMFSETVKKSELFTNEYWWRRSFMRKILLPIIKIFKKVY